MEPFPELAFILADNSHCYSTLSSVTLCIFHFGSEQ